MYLYLYELIVAVVLATRQTGVAVVVVAVVLACLFARVHVTARAATEVILAFSRVRARIFVTIRLTRSQRGIRVGCRTRRHGSRENSPTSRA